MREGCGHKAPCASTPTSTRTRTRTPTRTRRWIQTSPLWDLAELDLQAHYGNIIWRIDMLCGRPPHSLAKCGNSWHVSTLVKIIIFMCLH